MYYLNLKDGGHNWEKLNLITQRDNKGMFDLYKCITCGVKGKSYQIGKIELKGSYSRNRVEVCGGSRESLPSKVKVIHCTAYGTRFSNLTPNSIHDVIAPPKGEKNDYKGVWVMGVGEPVKLLNKEFIAIDD